MCPVQGKTYYFCCEGCLEDFMRNPRPTRARSRSRATLRAVLSVRELKALSRRLNDEDFARQLGPFVLVQRPILAKPKHAEPAGPKTTQPMASRKPASFLDFEALWVATLPPLAETDSFSLGRAPDCDLVFDEDTVSSHHARIDWRGDHAEIEDLGSSNGTFVNGVKLSGCSKLADSDAIDFGALEVFFFAVATLRSRMQPSP